MVYNSKLPSKPRVQEHVLDVLAEEAIQAVEPQLAKQKDAPTHKEVSSFLVVVCYNLIHFLQLKEFILRSPTRTAGRFFSQSKLEKQKELKVCVLQHCGNI